MRAALPCLLMALALLAHCAEAAPCSSSDVSIVQDSAYTDMATTFIPTRAGVEEDKTAVFITNFRLFCKSEQVKDVNVKASVSFRSGSGSYTVQPKLSNVAVLKDESGSYQVSFTIPERSMQSGEYKVDVFFVGESSPAASISLFHSVPIISGRHMEFLATIVLFFQAYYISGQFKTSQ
ncbi:hypothetical protein GUITHDRAFT_152080 [Guillardia theta CCMP2712]|uniref:Uncharacterized protein n=2 Tax=Guillardia theta TaxID=55529 RepID=L1JGR9_GUITC|nr:hypothetical protein GUITHDRAFT_152080 [Guillardia theta CCMP2712]EKX47324.1 hypothetical protein GUITHDRAFT_152080 [Guillardia theta CCMP2712]|eukprot:XP_005834304.1 hypothetical protein GUITHDRAFT_152080 [Guillardia theta CCMP2712]